ncbi:hypothetical protein LUZ60_004843 [Juncus effusus]|nr:hypothetical protein LUZ60_004843 [Juncus effusus]
MLDYDSNMLVDSDRRAMELQLLSFSSPHMRAFHLAWLSLFSCFISAFSVPPLLPVMNVTEATVATASVVSLFAIFISRLIMGPPCDLLGPRVASAFVSLSTAVLSVLVVLFGDVASPCGFIILRFVSGLSLANFVANQYWMSSMFAPSAVGLANAVSAGWANMGSAFAQLVMPLAYSCLLHVGVVHTMALRLVILLPAGLQTASAMAVLFFAQDLPEGNFSVTKKKTKRTGTENFWKIIKDGIGNYRGWILALTYGYCSGVELTMENNVAVYFRQKFNMGMETAGALASCFGMMNVISRPIGGMASDVMSDSFGMRGRLWALWLVQSVGAVMCLLLGRMSDGGASLGLDVMVLVVFAFFIQAASGLTFGVVPFVSKRSLGVISGMTGSGGAVGAIVTQLLFFSGSRFSIDTGISLMGLMMLICTIPITFIYFPKLGGMFCAPLISDESDDDGDYELLK